MRIARRLTWIVVAVAIVVVAGYGAIGWSASSQVIDGLKVTSAQSDAQRGGPFDVEVRSANSTQLVIVVPDDINRKPDEDAVMGLRWRDGYAQLGPSTQVDGTAETRPIEHLWGTLPPLGPKVGVMDPFAFPKDPADLGEKFENVKYPSPLGDLAGWFVPGTSSTWLVAVHGRGALRSEFLRTLDATRGLGYPTLVTTYRNDFGAPSANNSALLAGQDEWPDVDAAIRYAQGRGARKIVLVGASMGGALSLSYLLHVPSNPVVGLVLDAPLSSLREVVELRSGEALPVGGVIGNSMLAAARLVTTLRTGLNFGEVDYTAQAGKLRVPILYFQGTDDQTVPFAVGRHFADARPDLVEFHPIPDGGHVRAWNEDPAAYTKWVRDFLVRVTR